MDRYVFDAATCRQCKGLCCQGHPGAWADPERFVVLFLDDRPSSPGAIRNRLTQLGMILRDYSGVAVPAPRTTEGGCIFHGPEGCHLPEEKRPGQCLALVPDLTTLVDGECRCTLPGEFTYGAIRSRWQSWWTKAGPPPR